MKLQELQITHPKLIVAGRGISINSLPQNIDIPIIGLNDVERYHNVDYLVVLNEKPTYDLDRYITIESTKSKYVFSQLELPFKNLVKFSLGSKQNPPNLDQEAIDFSVSSDYVGVNIAYRLQAKNIAIVGVDMIGHTLSKRIDEINSFYRGLWTELQKRNVNLYNLSSKSLITTIPKITLEEFLEK